ncbi:MAG TPA: hypothetical protein VLK65_27855 [Vicinamibacteria bacterium]|nr:hypothetical protein [Vicinamibacteria bacterium]
MVSILVGEWLMGIQKVERDGWFIDIETLDVSRRPDWEIRVLIRRRKEDREEQRRHRFYVPKELSGKIKLDSLKEARREERLARAAKRVILREFNEIFAEPEGGLDSLRPLTESDLRE